MKPFRIMVGPGLIEMEGHYTLTDAREGIDEMVSLCGTTALPLTYAIVNRYDQVIEYREFSVQIKTTQGGGN